MYLHLIGIMSADVTPMCALGQALFRKTGSKDLP